MHWRKPRGTLRSRPTTHPLTAACTPTPRGAQCPPLMVAPTPALNQSQRSRPTERSCVWSPARPPSTVLSLETLLSTSPLLLFSFFPAFSCQSRRQREDCDRAAIIYTMLQPFSSLASILSHFHGTATTLNTLKVRLLCSLKELMRLKPNSIDSELDMEVTRCTALV